MLYLVVKNEIRCAAGLLAGTGIAAALAAIATFAFVRNEIVSVSLFVLFLVCHVWFSVYIFNYNEKRERLLFQLPLSGVTIWGLRYVISLLLLLWFCLVALVGGFASSFFLSTLSLTSFMVNICVTFFFLFFLGSHYLFIQSLEEWLFESGHNALAMIVELGYPAMAAVLAFLMIQQDGFGSILRQELSMMWGDGTIILPLLSLTALQIPLDYYFFRSRKQVHSAWARSPFLVLLNRDPFEKGR